MDSMGGGHLGPLDAPHVVSTLPQNMIEDLSRRNQIEDVLQLAEEDEGRCANERGVSFLSNTSYLCDLRHDIDEASVAASETGVVSRWRMKDRIHSQPPL